MCSFQMLDMIMPVDENAIALSDLRHCRMTPIFFDTFFNLEKYLDHEQRDPFASQRELDEDGNEVCPTFFVVLEMLGSWRRCGVVGVLIIADVPTVLDGYTV